MKLTHNEREQEVTLTIDRKWLSHILGLAASDYEKCARACEEDKSETGKYNASYFRARERWLDDLRDKVESGEEINDDPDQ